jgi:hypothetical protein
MALKESTFSKHEVEQFLLNTNNSFASCCWFNDIQEERPTYTQTANWFRRYFAEPNRAQFMFRLAECHCTQEAAYEETNA